MKKKAQGQVLNHFLQRYFIAQKSKHESDPEERRADRNFCGSFSGYSVNPFRERAE